MYSCRVKCDCTVKGEFEAEYDITVLDYVNSKCHNKQHRRASVVPAGICTAEKIVPQLFTCLEIPNLNT